MQLKLVRRGKVKDIYELSNGNILFHFSDRISAFDVNMETLIPRKGQVLCNLGEFWFNSLEVPHHMIAVRGADKMEVKRMTMIPLEFIVRGYFYGSFFERYLQNKTNIIFDNSFVPIKAAQLPFPVFDPSTKSEKHDTPISKEEIISTGILSASDLKHIEDISILLYKKMASVVGESGFILADVKFEFGIDSKGEILLGDSIGPDEFRLWLKALYSRGSNQESYDKQLLRDWLIDLGFLQVVKECDKRGISPKPPDIPSELVRELSSRYMYVFKKITKKTL
jgi:phosphoribosylaminoimidazole-succinocarboxamide synthase